MKLANYLYALVYSEMYDDDKWRDWAAQLLSNAEYNDETEWVYEAFLAGTPEKLYEVICERKYNENYWDDYKYTLTEIIQGYYFFQYQDKQIDLRELLLKSGDVQDASGSSFPEDCRFFYELCNDLEAHPKLAVSEDFTKIIYLKKLHHLVANSVLISCHMEWHHFRLERR